MHEAEEKELKVEIDRISQRIESILKKVEEVTPSPAKEKDRPEG